MSHVRIGAVHALGDSMAPTQLAFQLHWPDASVAHLLDGSLYLDRSAGTADAAEIARRVKRLIEHSAATGSVGVLFTGSFFAAAVRAARSVVSIPIATSFDGILESVTKTEGPVRIISTAVDSVTLLAEEVDALAAARGLGIETIGGVVAGAMDALVGGDVDRHDQLVIDHLNQIPTSATIVLAQFSMERVISKLRPRDAPTLGPAQEGVKHLRRIVGGGE
ncbi:MAG: hypothetical protein AAF493_27595 [Pseudomonadota bacterium]